MKQKNYLLWLILLFAFTANGQVAPDGFYYYQGKKVLLPVNTEYLFVSMKDNAASGKTTKTALERKGVEVSAFDTDNTRATLNLTDKKAKRNQNSSTHWAELKLTSGSSKLAYQAKIEELEKDADVQYVAPYFFNPNGKKVGLSNYFYVKLKTENDLSKLKKLADQNQIEVVGQNKYMPLWFTLSCTKESTFNAMGAANFFYETGEFQAAEPDLMEDLLEMNVDNTEEVINTNDTYFGDQWGLKNTGQYSGLVGTDINVEAAWDSTRGNPNIVVAVIDNGIELNHPDLQANIIGNGFDAETGTIPSIVRGDHGTACAGIIGASQDNNAGISGVATDVGLLSISVQFDGVTTWQDLANGINWAVANGASVISNSWGGGYQNQILDDAIKSALKNGRGGLGTVIVFSAGNSDAAVSYPASGNPDILAVGAMSPCGERTNPSSCDGEYWWGSNYGAELDVIAPGTKISTTDLQGANGYNEDGLGNHSDLDYTAFFNGTSAACPYVAGVAALVLSANPDLSAKKVNTIIERTAHKVRSDLYSYTSVLERLNGDWNNETGYGLVDAHEAVQLATSFLQPLYQEEPSSSGMYISKVQATGIDLPYNSTRSYNDFNYSKPVFLLKGESNLVEIENCPTGSQQYAVWIDFNGDNDFDDPNEKIQEANIAAGGTLSLNINIPDRAKFYLAKMRVMAVSDGITDLTPEGGYIAGQTNDYKIHLVDPEDYCLPEFGTSPGSNYIKGVCLNGTCNFGAGEDLGPVYSDFTAWPDKEFNLFQGAEGSVLTVYSSKYITSRPINAELEAWIDFDGDKVFEDAEKIGTHFFSTSNDSVKFNFDVPFSAILGRSRLRVRTSYPYPASESYPGPCDHNVCGEAEDYTINLLAHEQQPISPCAGENCDHIIAIADPLFTSINLQNGDKIRAFFEDDSGDLTLAGFVTYRPGAGGTSLTLSIDCSQTNQKNGFQVGEAIIWKLEICGTGQIIQVDAIYSPVDFLLGITNNTGNFECSASSQIRGFRPAQTVSLATGWSLISGYIDPSQELEDVLSPVVQEVVIAKDDAGNVFWPDLGISNLGSFDNTEGYFVRMSADQEVELSGSLIDIRNTPVNLPGRWSFLPIYKNADMPVAEVLDPIRDNLLIVKNINGEVYWPALGINQIGYLEPSKSYKIKMFESDVFYYPSKFYPDQSSFKIQNANKQKAQQNITTIRTSNNATVVLPLNLAIELGLSINDELLATNNEGQLVGSGLYNGENLAISIWGDDEFTEEKEGLLDGEETSFFIWSPNTSKTSTLIVDSWSSGDNFYAADGLNVIGGASIVTNIEEPETDDLGLSNWTVTPNPVSKKAHIKFNLENAKNLEIEIVNILGETVASWTNDEYRIGENNLFWDATGLSQGIYICRIISGKQKSSKKIIVQH